MRWQLHAVPQNRNAEKKASRVFTHLLPALATSKRMTVQTNAPTKMFDNRVKALSLNSRTVQRAAGHHAQVAKAGVLSKETSVTRTSQQALHEESHRSLSVECIAMHTGVAQS